MYDYIVKEGDKIEMVLPTHNTRAYTKKERILENLKWKLKFHEEQAEKIRQQIQYVEEKYDVE